MLTLVPIVLQLLEAGITVVPEIISAAQAEVALFNSGSAPTAAQQAQIDAAEAAASAALQAAVQGGAAA
jgi:hypothetical protein